MWTSSFYQQVQLTLHNFSGNLHPLPTEWNHAITVCLLLRSEEVTAVKRHSLERLLRQFAKWKCNHPFLPRGSVPNLTLIKNLTAQKKKLSVFVGKIISTNEKSSIKLCEVSAVFTSQIWYVLFVPPFESHYQRAYGVFLWTVGLIHDRHMVSLPDIHTVGVL